MQKFARILAPVAGLILMAAPAMATCGGGGGGGGGGVRIPPPTSTNVNPGSGDKRGTVTLSRVQTYQVPWKWLASAAEELPAATTTPASLVLCWIPASDQQYRDSSLRGARTLALYASRCVQLYVVDTKGPFASKLLTAEAKAPRLVLLSPDGAVLAKSENASDVTVKDAESLLRAEVEKRRSAAQLKLDDARKKVEAGDKDGAIADYQTVVQQKCLLPELAEKASQSLKELGTGTDAPPSSAVPSPKFDAKTGAAIEKLLQRGLFEEEKGDYAKALVFYRKAHEADPADPTPLRYLAELYRHDLGDWDEASRLFRQILNSESDPLSRAVALHGLGKITIHNGEFKKGLSLLEQSVDTYPLALAYRNLAVYWNSEGDPDKSSHYIDEALKIDPDDQFNRIFAAVFMASNGRRDEALKIARENESFLPASYNLAGIYAQLGMKDKALELLRRHFYEYERRDAVRAEEMMEARVDKVFDSLVSDERFLTLTNRADGKLPMRAGTTAH